MTRRFVVLTLLVGCGIALASALFTTFDHVSAEGQDCGSPTYEQAVDTFACADEIAHARSTRTAAAVWAVAFGVGAIVAGAVARSGKPPPPTAEDPAAYGPDGWRR